MCLRQPFGITWSYQDREAFLTLLEYVLQDLTSMLEQIASHASHPIPLAALMQLMVLSYTMQAPVGNDDFSFGYRDLEGSKVHKGLREEYGAPYKEVSQISDVPFFWLLIAAMKGYCSPSCRHCAAAKPCLI